VVALVSTASSSFFGAAFFTSFLDSFFGASASVLTASPSFFSEVFRIVDFLAPVPLPAFFAPVPVPLPAFFASAELIRFHVKGVQNFTSASCRFSWDFFRGFFGLSVTS
jgi:hypothetical protein